MSFSVNVDATNPGQFFACCGLLELADRLWPGAEGRFAAPEFSVDCKGDLKTLLSILVMDLPTAVLTLENGLPVGELLAPLQFSFDGGANTPLTLDAWVAPRVVKRQVAVVANPPWNLWSGQQTAYRIWKGLRAELGAQLARSCDREFKDLFAQRLFQKGRFGFDPGPAWNALDVGFSLNEHGIQVESSPAVEMLAAVGLQRFRPVVNEARDSFDYFTWRIPLPPAVAAAAAAGFLPTGNKVCYRGSVNTRGQYAALGFSYPVSRGPIDE